MYVRRLLIFACSWLMLGGSSDVARATDEQAPAVKAKPKVHARIQQNSDGAAVAREASNSSSAPTTSKPVTPPRYIFLGKVIKADLTGGIWSGIYACYKPVEFEVIAVAKGDLLSSTVVVHEVLLGPNERVLKSAQLSPTFYAPGTKLIVFADAAYRKEDKRIFLSNAQTYSETAWAALTAGTR